jgi:hypothetical protein
MSSVWRRRPQEELTWTDHEVNTMFGLLADIRENTEGILEILREDDDGQEEWEEAD